MSVQDKMLAGDQMGFLATDLNFIKMSATELQKLYFNLPGRRPGDIAYEKFISRGVSGSLAELIFDLQPLCRNARRKHLIIPTKSEWVAVFDDGWHGNHDETASIFALAAHKPHVNVGINPLEFSVYHKTPKLPEFETLSLSISFNEHDEYKIDRYLDLRFNVLGEWIFYNSGAPLDFEDVTKYAQRFKRDRFTYEMLTSYCEAMGLQPFDEDFYLSDRALLIEADFPPQEHVELYSLEDVARSFSSTTVSHGDYVAEISEMK